MSTIDVKEIPARIDEMLDAVARGETLAIVKNGLAVALLEPVRTPSTKKLPSMAAFRATIHSTDNSTTNSVVAMREQERY